MIIRAIMELAPNAEFTMTDDDLSTLVWHSTDIAQPSDADINAKAQSLANGKGVEDLRIVRDRKLQETDHWMFSDTATATQAQLDYRQALRDITDNATSLDDVTWPEKP